MRLVGYDMARAAANKVYEQAGVGPGAYRRRRTARLLRPQRLITYEALGLSPEERRAGVHRRWRQHLWRQGGHQPLRRPAFERSSARRHRPCAMLRTDTDSCGTAEASRSRAPGAAFSTVRPAPASVLLYEKIEAAMVDASAIGPELARPMRASTRTPALPLQYARRGQIRSTTIQPQRKSGGFVGTPIPPTYLFVWR